MGFCLLFDCLCLTETLRLEEGILNIRLDNRKKRPRHLSDCRLQEKENYSLQFAGSISPPRGACMSDLTTLLPRIFSFLDTFEDIISVSRVNKGWRSASRAAKPVRLAITPDFYLDGWEQDSHSKSDADQDCTRSIRRQYVLFDWFKRKVGDGSVASLRSMILDVGHGMVFVSTSVFCIWVSTKNC